MRITACLRYDAGLYMGGGELQALDTMHAIGQLGHETSYYQLLDREVGDLVHFFGSMPYYQDLAKILKEREVPYVVSSIYVSRRSGSYLRFKRRLSQIQGSYPKNLQRFLRGSLRIFTLSSLEERNLRDVFGDGLPPFCRVPIGIDARFFNADPGIFRSTFGDSPFVFHSGGYSERKGQLRLLRAAKGLGVRIVCAGPVHEPHYFAQCQLAASKDDVLLTDLKKSDPILASAYAAAEAFCLPSEAEILCASALEAGVAGCRLALSDTWGADEYFAGDAEYHDPKSDASIRSSLERALSKPHDRDRQAAAYHERFQWAAVARTIVAEYEAVLGGARPKV